MLKALKKRKMQQEEQRGGSKDKGKEKVKEKGKDLEGTQSMTKKKSPRVKLELIITDIEIEYTPTLLPSRGAIIVNSLRVGP